MLEYAPKRTREHAAIALDHLLPEIGHLYLDQIDQEALGPYIEKRQEIGIMSGTINKELSYVRRVLNLAAHVWRVNGHLWLATAPHCWIR